MNSNQTNGDPFNEFSFIPVAMLIQLMHLRKKEVQVWPNMKSVTTLICQLFYR